MLNRPIEIGSAGINSFFPLSAIPLGGRLHSLSDLYESWYMHFKCQFIDPNDQGSISLIHVFWFDNFWRFFLMFLCVCVSFAYWSWFLYFVFNSFFIPCMLFDKRSAFFIFSKFRNLNFYPVFPLWSLFYNICIPVIFVGSPWSTQVVISMTAMELVIPLPKRISRGMECDQQDIESTELYISF